MSTASTLPVPEVVEEVAGSTARPHRYIPGLDGIRGLAIILVLVHHLFVADFRNIRSVDALFQALSTGWIGVDVFFVLSGFLISGLLIDGRSQPRYFLDFYARRSLRIFPLYFGVIALGLAIALLWPASSQEFLREQAWLWSYLTNVRLVIANQWLGFAAGPLTFSHFWSLAIEEHFYIVWPLIVYLCPPRKLLALCLTLAGLSCAARWYDVWSIGNTFRAYIFTPFRLEGLLLGSAGAMAVRSEAKVAWISKYAPKVLVAFVVLAAALYPLTGWDKDSKVIASFGYSLLSLGAAALVLTVVTQAPGHPVRTWSESRVLRAFGKYSYGLYALHLLAFSLVHQYAAPLLRHIPSSTAADLAEKPLQIAAAIVAALLSWHLFEKHFLKLKKYF